MLKPSYINVIKLLESKLSKAKINWALTGSTSFALQGLSCDPYDIDIQTDQKGAFEIQSLFKEHKKREVALSTKNNLRSYFGELNMNGISIEIIGDIQKFVDGKWETAPDLNEIKRYISVYNIVLPVLSLEYEVEAYRKLGRNEKADFIARYIGIDGSLA